MDARETGKLVILVGIAVIVVGALLWLGGLSWFGRLPGDIRYERGGTRVYAPIASMLLVSVVLSLLVALARRLF